MGSNVGYRYECIWQYTIDFSRSIHPVDSWCSQSLRLSPIISVSKALQLLKGAYSYELFRRQPLFRYRYLRGSFWSPGKFYRSVGDTDTETVLHTSEINDSNKYPSTIIHLWGYRTNETPQFIAGSMSLI
jgi:hypothetical protein